jgi:hypothetical protein
LFGYVKPYKSEMKIKEFDTYKAVYCGLCKRLGKVYGPFARLTLSYDFTFLAIVSSGLNPEFCGFRVERCIYNPLKKKACLVPCHDLTFSASAAMVMFYYKLKDNYEDGGLKEKLLSLCLMPFAGSARKKAMKEYPHLEELVKQCMDNQYEVEHSDTLSIDRAAEPSASALSGICEMLADDPVQKKVLGRLGYLLGRYVYFIDALDDLEDDIKTGSYNIFYKKFSAEGPVGDTAPIHAYARETINLTVGQIAAAYELLDFKRYKPILDNIIYLGLHESLNQVLLKKTANQPGQKAGL